MGFSPTWYELFNYAEAVAWWLIGVWTVWRVPVANGRERIAVWTAFIVFVVFGCSDWLEASRQAAVPGWLFGLKISCGAALLACRFTYLGWSQFHWRRRELWFALACLIAVACVAWLQNHSW